MLAPKDVYHEVPLQQRGIRRSLCNNSGAAFFACWVKNETMLSLSGVSLTLPLHLLLCIFTQDCCVSHVPYHCEIVAACSWRLLRQQVFLHLLHKKDFYLKEEWQDGFLDQRVTHVL